MVNTAIKQAEELLRESLKELESVKGSILTGVQKLLRAARMLGEDDIATWCEIQLGNSKFTTALSRAVENWSVEMVSLETGLQTYLAENKETNSRARKISAKKTSKKESSDYDKKLATARTDIQALNDLRLKEAIHYPSEERHLKAQKSGGGYQNIGSIEQIYADLSRTKRGNDGTYYQVNLSNHINYVRRIALEHATKLYNRIAFSDTPQTSLDILKAAVDDKLLDLSPEIGEKLMIAFKSVASDNPEEWSHALTTCRRFLEALADTLFPAREGQLNGRMVGQPQYINRLWAFMDGAIDSESNKALAKAHVDYLGNYLEKTHVLGHKGVHAALRRVEAIKAVFHTYLVAADILDYLKNESGEKAKKLNIHTATLDELESMLDVNRNVAKDIIKLRVQHGLVDLSRLATVKGIGQKTLSRAEQLLSFEPVK